MSGQGLFDRLRAAAAAHEVRVEVAGHLAQVRDDDAADLRDVLARAATNDGLVVHVGSPGGAPDAAATTTTPVRVSVEGDGRRATVRVSDADAAASVVDLLVTLRLIRTRTTAA